MVQVIPSQGVICDSLKLLIQSPNVCVHRCFCWGVAKIKLCWGTDCSSHETIPMLAITSVSQQVRVSSSWLIASAMSTEHETSRTGPPASQQSAGTQSARTQTGLLRTRNCTWLFPRNHGHCALHHSIKVWFMKCDFGGCLARCQSWQTRLAFLLNLEPSLGTAQSLDMA